MKVYTMELVRKEMGQWRTLDNKIVSEFIESLVFAIPQKYLDDDDDFCINDYVYSEDRLLSVPTGFNQDGCNYDEFNLASHLIVGQKYDLVFAKEVGRFGQWYVLETND